MGIEPSFVAGAVLIGLGATALVDLWSLLLKRALGIPSLNFCLLGRWILHMPGGTFRHASISAAEPKSSECAVGWAAHYAVGVAFAFGLLGIVSASWLEQPTLMPALLFGVVTVLFPFLVMQPSFGLGIAASKSPNPMQARLKSLTTHVVFGVALYVVALAVSPILRTID